jgi:hypothetical protein
VSANPSVTVLFGEGGLVVVEVPAEGEAVSVSTEPTPAVAVTPAPTPEVAVDVTVDVTRVVEVASPSAVVVDAEVVDAPHVIHVPLIGPRGPAANVESLYHVHLQDMPLAVWEITHPFGDGVHPQVTIVDTLGREVEAHVIYQDDGVIRVEFSAPFAGRAFLS